jgi:hypothetical protein
MDDEAARVMQRAMDPLYDVREEMPGHEFDGVDFFVNEPRRSPPPRPTVLTYFDSGLPQAGFADRIDRVVADMAAVLARTTPLPLRPRLAAWVLRGQADGWQLDWSEETRDALVAALRTGQAEVASIMFTAGRDDAHRWYLECHSYPWPEKEPDAALSLSLSSRDLWPIEATDTVAQQVLELIVSWTALLDLRTAGVTYDRTGPDRTPYECWYGMNSFDSAPLTRERVRGYYWANLLTAGHLARLGGLQALRDQAAPHGFVVQPVDLASPAVVLRAAGPITSFDDDRLAAMKRLLKPVLPPRRYTGYQGYPLRIVPDPGTALRRVPPGSPFPRLLPGQGPPPDGDDHQPTRP